MNSGLIKNLFLIKDLSYERKQQIIDFIQEFASKMKNIEEMLLDYLDQNEEQDYNYQTLINYLEEINIRESKIKLRLFFHMIVQICNNHFRSNNFFSKINKILAAYQKEAKDYFSNYEILDIFKNNMLILLYLFKNKIIVPDQAVFNVICNNKYKNKNYPKYFFHEIKNFLDTNLISEHIDITNNEYESKREIGENCSFICQLIRNDSVIDFISHVNRINYSLLSNIEESIYETNEFLIGKAPSLIEYASFYGSIQIFRYLVANNVQMTPSLWLYAIHGRNPDIIHLLEENHIMPKDTSFNECLIESIKCHHNEIANYIKNNLLNQDFNLLPICLKHYYFSDTSLLVNDDDDFNDYFLCSCKYDYIPIFEFLCNTIEFDPNTEIKFESTLKTKTDSLLNIVIRKGNIEILQILLSRYDIDVNNKYIKINKECIEYDYYRIKCQKVIKTIENKTPLIIAIEKGNYEIVKLLIEQSKIDINSDSSFQRLEYCLYNNKINEKTKVNHQENKNALIIAIENNLYDIFLLLLLSKKINPLSKFTQIDSQYKGNHNICCARVNKFYEKKEVKDLLIIAIEKANLNIIQKLLNTTSINPNSKQIKLINFEHAEKEYEEKSALIIAIENQNIEVIRLLLSFNNTNVNSIQFNREDNERIIIQNNALIIAVMTKNIEIVKLLLSRNDIDVNNKYTVKAPIVIKSVKCTSYLSDSGLNEEKTALLTAIELKNEKMVQLLLSKPETNLHSKLIHIQSKVYIDKNKKYYSKQTEYKSEFIKAVEQKNYEIVKLFLQRNDLDVNFRSTLITDSNIYEYYETEFCKSESYKKFEKKKVEESALHIATKNCDTEIIQLLLKNPKIDVNNKYKCYKEQTYINEEKEKKKNYEKTALHIAVEKQNTEIVRLFLEMNQTDIDAKFIKNSNLYKSPIIKTPLMIAEEEENVNIIDLLLKKKNL